MIHVVAIITAKPEQREKMLEAARANVAAVLAEDGCIEYTLVVDAEGFGGVAKLGPDSFAFIERWRDAEALKAHSNAPHMNAYRANVGDLTASRTVHVLAPAE